MLLGRHATTHFLDLLGQTPHLGFAKVGSFEPRVGSIFFQGIQLPIQVNVDFYSISNHMDHGFEGRRHE